MTSHSPELPAVCFLCLESFQTKEKATALDLDMDMLSQKFLVFTENHLDLPSEKWALDKVKLKNALCFNCSSVISVLCSLYDNLCDIQAKLEDKMGQLTSLLEGSKERMTRRKGKSLMETLERQLCVGGSDGKKMEEMRDLLGDKCKIYSKKPFHQKTLQTSFSEEDNNDGNNSEAGDIDSVDVKIENNSINGSDDDDDENCDYFNGDPMDEQDPDHSATSNDDDKNIDEDDDDSDFNLEKGTSPKKSPAGKGPFRCELCGKEFSLKASLRTHMKNIHGNNPPKPEKPFSCKLCPIKLGTRVSLLSHISFKHRGHSILNKPFKCDICGRGCTTQNGVVLHKKRVHTIEPQTKHEEHETRPLSDNCSKCSMSFETQRQKTHHTYTVHNKQMDGGLRKNDTVDSNDDLQNDVNEQLHNDSNDSLNLDPTKMDEKDLDYSAPTSSSSSSSDHDDINSFDEDEDEADPDFSLEKETTTATTKFRDKRYSCDLCGKQFSNKFSIPPHKKNIHGTNPKPEKPFSCKFCPNKFGTRISLLSHISLKHRGHSILNRSFKCDICSRGFTTQNGVLLHKKKMHGIGPLAEPTYDPKRFPCDFCPKSFRDMTSWRRHLKAKHKSCSSEVFFTCRQCPLKFDTLQQRVNHTKNVHKKDDEAQMTTSLSYSCTECPMSFETQRQKVHHTYTVHKKDKQTGGFMKRVQDAMRTDTSDQTEQSCVVCSKEFKSWKLLHSHLKQRHEKVAENKKTQMCYFCNRLFCYEQSVWAHLKTCITHNFTTIEFPCDHADHLGHSQWVFKNPTELETHFKEDHEDCEILRCGACSVPFLDKNMLEFHRLVHLPKINCKYQCPGCLNTFLNTDTLQHHYNSIHGVSLKLYRCKYCSMGFAAKAAVPLHSSWCRANNKGGKEQVLEFLCSECPKSYETAYQLKNHVRMIHTTTQCPDCGVVLPKSRIANHKIMKHGKEKFLCTLCGKAYKKRPQLQMHMSSHGQYKWICKYCGSGSRSSGHLRRHIGRMHKDKLAEEAAAKKYNQLI